METDLRAASMIVDAQSTVSWAVIAAGVVGAAALAAPLRDGTWNDRGLTPPPI